MPNELGRKRPPATAEGHGGGEQFFRAEYTPLHDLDCHYMHRLGQSDARRRLGAGNCRMRHLRRRPHTKRLRPVPSKGANSTFRLPWSPRLGKAYVLAA